MASEYRSFIKTLRAGDKPEFPADAGSIDYARQLDAQDKLSSFRDKFNIPTRGSLKKKALSGSVACRHPFPLSKNAMLISSSKAHGS
jgi:kynureninase